MAATRMWLRNNLAIVRVQAAVFSHRRRTIMSNIGLSQKRLVIATVFLNAVAFAGAAHSAGSAFSSGAPPPRERPFRGSGPLRKRGALRALGVRDEGEPMRERFGVLSRHFISLPDRWRRLLLDRRELPEAGLLSARSQEELRRTLDRLAFAGRAGQRSLPRRMRPDRTSRT